MSNVTGPAKLPVTVETFVRRATEVAAICRATMLEVTAPGQKARTGYSPERCASLIVPAEPFSGPLPLAGGQFGLVVCVDLLHRLSGTDQLLCELGRTLADGGRLFVSIPLTVAGRAGPGHSPTCASLGLNYLLSAAGLELEYLEPLSGRSDYAVVAHRSTTNVCDEQVPERRAEVGSDPIDQPGSGPGTGPYGWL